MIKLISEIIFNLITLGIVALIKYLKKRRREKNIVKASAINDSADVTNNL